MVDVDRSETQEELLAQIKQFLPENSIEDGAFIDEYITSNEEIVNGGNAFLAEYDTLKPEVEVESFSEEFFNEESFEFFEENDNQSIPFSQSKEESSEIASIAHVSDLPENDHSFTNAPVSSFRQTNLASNLIESPLQSSNRQHFLGNSLPSQKTQNNTESFQKTENAPDFPLAAELGRSRSKSLISSKNNFDQILDLSLSQTEAAVNSENVGLLSHGLNNEESHDNQDPSQDPSDQFYSEELEFLGDEENNFTVNEKNEDGQMNFDPSVFKLPSIDIRNLSRHQKDSVDQSLKRGMIQGLHVDNKTATFIFVLLSSLASPSAFLSQGLSEHLTDGKLIPGEGHLYPPFPVPPVQLPLQSSTNKMLSPGNVAGLGFPTRDSTYVSLYQEIRSFEPNSCSKAPPPSCANSFEGFCIQDSNYPTALIQSLLKEDAALASKYAEVVKQSAVDLVPSLTEEQEKNFDYNYFNPSVYDSSHWFGPQGYICPSRVGYSRPVRARNAKEEWKIIINDGNFYTQTLRLEICMYPNTPCRLVAPCFRSKCLQKYSYHRLLAFDPCHPSKGLHIDMFRLPSACSCYAPSFLGVEDLIANGDS